MCPKKLALALALIVSSGAAAAQAGTRVTLNEVLLAESEITRNQLEAKRIESLGDAAKAPAASVAAPAAAVVAPAAASAPAAKADADTGPDLESVLGVGDRLHATVVFNGRRHDVRTGDTFAGFKVLALDPNSITLRSSSGTTQRVTFSQALPPPKQTSPTAFTGMPPLMPIAPQ